MNQLLFTGVAAILLLGGCAVGPDHVRPEPPQSTALEQGEFLRSGNTLAETPASRWWDGLGDPVLSGLIETGLARAPSVEAAQARLRQARAGIAASRAAILPTLSATGTYIHADLPSQAFGTGSGQIELFNLGFDANWEADLWGGKAREVVRSRADAATAAAMLADVRVSLSSEIARTYVSLRAREASLRLLEQRRLLDVRLVAMARDRFEGGTATRQQMGMAKQALNETLGEEAAVGAEIAVLRDGLAVLTGMAPGAHDDLPATAVPLPPAEVSIGDPAAMLARRPDIMAAESRLASASAGIGAARARQYPSISLLGLIGIGGSSLGDVFDPSQLSAIAVPRLSWSFLDFGRNAAAIRRAEAGRDAQLAEYRASVLAALQDAEAALARFGAARITFARAIKNADLGEETARLQLMRADAGTISQGDALASERQSLDLRIAELNRKANLTLAYIALAKSLGLGWQEVAAEVD